MAKPGAHRVQSLAEVRVVARPMVPAGQRLGQPMKLTPAMVPVEGAHWPRLHVHSMGPLATIMESGGVLGFKKLTLDNLNALDEAKM